jgi:hypothetical protein
VRVNRGDIKSLKDFPKKMIRRDRTFGKGK